ncbi:MAG TPA: hypothetical protein VFF00_04200 [Candidatus Elarobacter sp.]|nr:hypothetical protein [Candidatus Elarobacter sp.]
MVGDAVGKHWSIRRQLRHLRDRAAGLENRDDGAFLSARLDVLEADWRAGVLNDAVMQQIVIDEIYNHYIIPDDAARARKVSPGKAAKSLPPPVPPAGSV